LQITSARRTNTWFICQWPWVVLTFGVTIAAGWHVERPLVADSSAYRAMALGRFGDIPGSICGRFLHPTLVHVVSWVTGLNIDRAFAATSLIALAFLIGSVAWILKKVTGIGVLVLPLLSTPVLVDEMFRLYYCQDLFYAALLAGFILSLIATKSCAALLILFALCLTRESTILLSLIWVVLAWMESDRFTIVTAVTLTAAGLFVSRLFASLGTSNIHHTDEFVFLILKPPFDLLRNLFGMVLVPDEVKGMRGFACDQMTLVHLPVLLRYGSTRTFGICSPDISIPVRTLTLWLSLFGIGPAMMWSIVRRNDWKLFSDSPLWLKLMLIYGLCCFVLAPCVSFWLERDIGYAWPAFWVAIPALLRRFQLSSRAVIRLLLENLAACWIPYLFITAASDGTCRNLIFGAAALSTALILQLIALFTLKSAEHQHLAC
jgi:hypothetical protein